MLIQSSPEVVVLLHVLFNDVFDVSKFSHNLGSLACRSSQILLSDSVVFAEGVDLDSCLRESVFISLNGPIEDFNLLSFSGEGHVLFSSCLKYQVQALDFSRKSVDVTLRLVELLFKLLVRMNLSLELFNLADQSVDLISAQSELLLPFSHLVSEALVLSAYILQLVL